jgi:O-acetylhomoserine/O-acetylserine sulfhydrylase-like pyridoxal-dependent enzyme
MNSDSHFDTRAVRAGSTRSEFLEHSEAMFLTSSFLFESAADAAEHFKPGHTRLRLLALLEPDGVDVPGPPCLA